MLVFCYQMTYVIIIQFKPRDRQNQAATDRTYRQYTIVLAPVRTMALQGEDRSCRFFLTLIMAQQIQPAVVFLPATHPFTALVT